MLRNATKFSQCWRHLAWTKIVNREMFGLHFENWEHNQPGTDTLAPALRRR
jgi:hypothetical protein